MYVPAHFALATDDCVAVLRSLGAADLVTVHEDGPDATYLPLQYVEGARPCPAAANPARSAR